MSGAVYQIFARTLATAAIACALLAPSRAAAQPMMPSGGPEGPKPLTAAKVLDDVSIEQKLDAQLPADLKFRDEAGNVVRLGDYFGKGRPLLLTLVYYECPGLCTETLNGVARALKPMKFTAGTEFDLLTVSFDPRETPQLAAAKKEHYLKVHNRPGAEKGWHFLTGDEPDIQALCKTVGFRYTFDENTKQYAHASAIMVITPQGRVSRYFYGLEYSTRDIQWGLVEASEERIGSLADAVMLYCYKYDPKSGKYSMQIMYALRILAAATVLSLGTFMFVMFRRDRRAKLQPAAAAPDARQPGSGIDYSNSRES